MIFFFSMRIFTKLLATWMKSEFSTLQTKILNPQCVHQVHTATTNKTMLQGGAYEIHSPWWVRELNNKVSVGILCSLCNAAAGGISSGSCLTTLSPPGFIYHIRPSSCRWCCWERVCECGIFYKRWVIRARHSHGWNALAWCTLYKHSQTLIVNWCHGRWSTDTNYF